MSKSEVQAKLKSLIEEKLCSLGAYVDKELPEYILVMIANKKNKISMEKDLQLFLGQDTTIFIEWLHDLLGKCQDNIEKVVTTNKIKSPEIVDRSSQEKKKKKDKLKPKKARKSDEKKEVRKSSVVKVRRSRSRSISPKKIKVIQPDKVIKTTVNTPDKTSKKVNIDTKKNDTKPTEKAVVIEKPQYIMSSIVKVTERPIQNIEILKPSVTMIQRDIKEAESNNIKRRDLPQQLNAQPLPEQRSSVFSRLGNNDLRTTKLAKKSSPNSEEKHILKRRNSVEETQFSKRRNSPEEKYTLKRTMDRDEPEEIEDEGLTAWSRHTKVQKNSEEKPVSTNFIVTLKGAERLNLPLKSRLGPKKNADDVLVAESLETMETEPEVIEDPKENVTDVVVTSAPSRCKFWPNCKNKDSCPFVHPNELCTLFPNCKFGASCLFMHPNCRFEPNCTKIDCPFTHRQPRAMTALKPPSSGLQQRCLYYPNCTNVNCKFFHPNLPCKFGQVCKAKDTCMFYHPTIPHRTELRWVASEEKMATTTNNCAEQVSAII